MVECHAVRHLDERGERLLWAPDPPVEREPGDWRHNHELTARSEVPHTLSHEHTEGWPSGAREERAENKNPHRRAAAPCRYRAASPGSAGRARGADPAPNADRS